MSYAHIRRRHVHAVHNQLSCISLIPRVESWNIFISCVVSAQWISSVNFITFYIGSSHANARYIIIGKICLLLVYLISASCLTLCCTNDRKLTIGFICLYKKRATRLGRYLEVKPSCIERIVKRRETSQSCPVFLPRRWNQPVFKAQPWCERKPYLWRWIPMRISVQPLLSCPLP